MGGNATGDPVTDPEALAGQGTIGSKFARHARQKPRRADVGKETNADLRHGEGEPVARDTMRAMYGYAHAAAHRNAVDQCNVRLAIVLDRRVQRIFVAPELQRLLVASRLAQIVERANVAPSGKGAPVLLR